MTVEHELLRNVLLSANFNYANQDYQDFGRVDDVYGVTLTGKYLLTRNLATTLNIGVTLLRRANAGARSFALRGSYCGPSTRWPIHRFRS